MNHPCRLLGEYSGLLQEDHGIDEGTGQAENMLQAEQKGRSQRRAFVETINQIGGLLCHDSKLLDFHRSRENYRQFSLVSPILGCSTEFQQEFFTTCRQTTRRFPISLRTDQQ